MYVEIFNSHNSKKKLRKIARMLYVVQVGSQKDRSIFFFLNYFHIQLLAKTWLNLLMDDRHFGYIIAQKKPNMRSCCMMN